MAKVIRSFLLLILVANSSCTRFFLVVGGSWSIIHSSANHHL
jgi:hypothetical protein